jgi:hypothetical protein
VLEKIRYSSIDPMTGAIILVLLVICVVVIAEWRLGRMRDQLVARTLRFERAQTRLSDAVIALQRMFLEGRGVEEVFQASAHLLTAWDEYSAVTGLTDEPKMVREARLLVTERMLADDDTTTV